MLFNKKRNSILTLGVWFFIISIFVSITGFLLVHRSFSYTEFIQDFYANIAAELGSIAITIILVDRIVKRQEGKENEFLIKSKLLSELHSPVNSIANNAAHELRSLGKLTGVNAWTISARLGGKADLSGARLYDANFENARLVGANLFDADLRNANFCASDMTGVNLYKANLEGAIFNERTILPDGRAWSNDIDMSEFINQEKFSTEQNWLDLLDITGARIDDEGLASKTMTTSNFIVYLKNQFPDIRIAKDELHFFRHWRALLDFDYKTLGDVDGLLYRTEQAREWIWDGRRPEYLIVYIAFAIALENPDHLNLPHWDNETRQRIIEARRIFYSQDT